MRTFVRLDQGIVVEVFPPAGLPEEIVPKDGDIRSLYHPDFSKLLIETTGLSPQPCVGWLFADGEFSLPEEPESSI